MHHLLMQACIFSDPVEKVSNTEIFVTRLNTGQQFTAYGNKLERKAGSNKVARILPFPNHDGSITSQSQIMWNMEEYPHFFEDCKKLFPMPSSRGVAKGVSRSLDSASTLPIFACGAFQYSVVSNFTEFSALNFTHFGLPPRSISLLSLLQKTYGVGYGFLVSVYTADGNLPPTAYIHPTLPDGRLFVPTMHDHDGNGGTAKAKLAEWDHTIYILNNAAPVQVDGNYPLINAEYANSFVSYEAQGSPNWNNLVQVFNYKFLPPGFPFAVAYAHPSAGQGLVMRMKIEGRQSNGDLAFATAHGIAKCFRDGECTRKVTGENYTHQPLYYCNTCWPDKQKSNGACLCRPCMELHARHGHMTGVGDGGNVGFCDSNLIQLATL